MTQEHRPLRDAPLPRLKLMLEAFAGQPEVVDLVRAELAHREADEPGLEGSAQADPGKGEGGVIMEPPDRSGDGPRDPRAVLMNFLSTRGMEKPDGRPLYRYHAADGEMVELEEALSPALSRAQVGPWAAMGFCLWAAEWWRQRHSGGPWKWGTLLDRIGHPEFAPGDRRYNDLLSTVSLGLEGWRRNVLKVGESRGFLVTLACEGGLPLTLILREQTHLRAYFKALLEEFRLYQGTNVPGWELAERVRDRLPKGLRQEVVYQLAAELIEKIWELQRELGETLTPVRDLDARHPGWRDELPVRVTDEVARTLLNNLILDAAEVARGGRIKARWNVLLGMAGEGNWRLEGSLELPSVLEASDFNLLFGRRQDTEPPTRFDLLLQDGDNAPQVVALGSGREETSKGRFVGLEMLPTAKAAHRKGLESHRVLIARTRDEMLTASNFPGSSGLSELPWVFTPEDPAAELAQPHRLAGQGAIKVRERWALVAVEEGAEAQSADGGSAVLIGNVTETSRQLFQVTGQVTFIHGDDRVTVETGSAVDTSKVEYAVIGRTRALGRSAIEVFVGPPKLQEKREGGFPVEVPTHHLRWKPVASKEWYPYGSGVVGTGTLQYVAPEGLRCSMRLHILPAGTDLDLIPSSDGRRGKIIVKGIGDGIVALHSPPSVTHQLEQQGREIALSLAASEGVPDDVAITITWPRRGRIQLQLPYPATRARFVGADGAILPPESCAAVGVLAGVTAEVIAPTQALLDVQVTGLGVPMLCREMQVLGRGYYSLNLAVLQPRIEEMLQRREDPDADVKLQMHSNDLIGSLPPHRLFAKRFDLQLERREGDPGLFGLDERSRMQARPSDVEELELEAFSLLDPQHDAVQLERWTSDSWRLPEGITPGPYLILGRHGSWYRVQPMRWFVIGAGLLPTPVAPESLAQLYAGGLPPADDLQPFMTVADSLAENPDHADWPVVFSYLQQLSLPPHTFELVRAIVQRPSAAALAAIMASSIDLPVVLSRLAQFPFAWWQVPLSDWEHALQCYTAFMRSQLQALTDQQAATQLLQEDLRGKVSRIAYELPGLQPAFGFARARLLGLSIEACDSRIVNPTMRQHLQADYERHRRGCPALKLGGSAIPDMHGLSSEVRRIQQANPWSSPLFVPRTGMGPFVSDPARADFADGPAVAALHVLGCGAAAPDLAHRIRHLRACHPEWFDEALRLAQLIAFGTMKDQPRINA